MHPILISPEEIAGRIACLGEVITQYYSARSEPLTVLALLKGSVYFAADLTRQIRLPLQLTFLSASSYYDGTTSSGTVHCPEAVPDLSGRHLLILDDILDTGLTLSVISRKLAAQTHALSIRTAVLLKKPKAQEFQADWVGFEIDDRFVIGYGLDHAQEYRNLPGIHVV